jgi:LPS sulfotransferase NodH
VPIILPDRFGLLRAARNDPITQAMPLRNGHRVALPEAMAYVFIVFTCRTGSFYLAHLLASSGFFNNAGEDLGFGPCTARCQRDGIGSFAEYFAAVAQSDSRNNVYVVKSSAEQLALLTYHGVMQRIHRRSRFIFLERADKLAQAISWAIAVQTDDYLSYGATESKPLVYNGDEIADRIGRIVHENAQIAHFFGINGIVPLHLIYERMVAAPVAFAESVCRFVGHPEVACDPARIALRRQATEVNRAWRARFLAEQATG